MIIKSRLQILTLFSSLLLFACSPHPGSGIWVPLDDRDATYSKLVVLFEGRAELYVPGREGHQYRCFWGGTGSDSIHMECVSADNETDKPLLTFRVVADGTGELVESGQTIGFFQRTNEKPTRQ